MEPCATVAPVSRSSCDVGGPRPRHTARVGELKMAGVKRWLVTLVVGGTLLVGLTHCVVVPDPVPSGYVVTPPVVVIRPYRPYRYYAPYPYYRPYRPYYGWHPYGRRW